MHQDKFKVYFGDINIKAMPKSEYSYRRGIRKNVWITKCGKDIEHFTDFVEMNDRLNELKEKENDKRH